MHPPTAGNAAAAGSGDPIVSRTSETVMAEIAALRRRVEQQYPSARAGDGMPLADLLPLFHARDAAEGKVAAIGKVNPRPPGLANAVIQAAKRTLARTLQWLIRDQVDFNAATVRAFTETIEALNAVNRSLAAAQSRMEAIEASLGEARLQAEGNLREATDSLSAQIRSRAQEAHESLEDFAATLRQEIQQAELRLAAASAAEVQDAERRLSSSVEPLAQAIAQQQQRAARQAAEREREDIRLLRTLADVQNGFAQRMSLLEASLKEAASQQAALAGERAAASARDELMRGISRLESQIHSELRTLRQRAGAVLSREARHGSMPPDDGERILQAAQVITAPEPFFDSLQFAERFRGPEHRVREDLRVHLPLFASHAPVLDLGCGRGEFLELLRDVGVDATGVEANPELVRLLASKGLRATEADLFQFLESQPEASVGGVFCAHVIEHMPAEQLVRLVSLAARVLRPGGVLAFETPNPACLAIFATYFYLDPTHVRPVPHELVTYLLEEAGFQDIQVTGLHPADGDFAALKPLPDGFRQQFFGFMDYAVSARRP